MSELPEPDDHAWEAAQMLAAMVNVWTVRGRLAALDKYLTARQFCTDRRSGRNPLGNLRPFAEFHRVVTDAAVACRWPYVEPRGAESGSARPGAAHD